MLMVEGVEAGTHCTPDPNVRRWSSRVVWDTCHSQGNRIERESGKVITGIDGMFRTESCPLQDHLRDNVLHLWARVQRQHNRV
jgi:hypothetical protein